MTWSPVTPPRTISSQGVRAPGLSWCRKRQGKPEHAGELTRTAGPGAMQGRGGHGRAPGLPRASKCTVRGAGNREKNETEEGWGHLFWERSGPGRGWRALKGFPTSAAWGAGPSAICPEDQHCRLTQHPLGGGPVPREEGPEVCSPSFLLPASWRAVPAQES